jgi:hypothetical protein
LAIGFKDRIKYYFFLIFHFAKAVNAAHIALKPKKAGEPAFF